MQSEEKLPSYRVTARNFDEESPNKIHSDEVAAKYGFRGALVPGVALYGYMTRPVVDTFGTDWLTEGTMSAKFIKPIYDGEETTAGGRIVQGDPPSLDLELRNGANEVCAVGQAGMRTSEEPPLADLYPHADLPMKPYQPFADVLEPGLDLGSSPCVYKAGAEHQAFVEKMCDDTAVYAKHCHPAFAVAQANYMLMANVTLGPWIHTASEVTHWDEPRHNENLELRGCVDDSFTRKGHEMVVLDLALIGEMERIIATLRHTAIVRLAPAE